MKAYKDVCIEIDLLMVRIQDLEAERKRWVLSMFKSIPPFTPLDNCASRIDEIDDKLREYVDELEKKKTVRKTMDLLLDRLEGLEYQVAHRRDILGMSLMEIADDLGYSYDWIKRVSMRINKQYTRTTLTS